MHNQNNIFAKRRSIYNLGNKRPITDIQLENIIKDALNYVPSAFNSQSSRIVLLLNDFHIKFWDSLVLNTLKGIVAPKNFEKTKNKITSFSKGYGTLLYFEDLNIINNLTEQFPEYADNFFIWANQTSGMLQYLIWTLFAEKNIGASLQHYNPIIDDIVKNEFNIDTNWKLIAQMPFGNILKPADTKTLLNSDKKLKIFK